MVLSRIVVIARNVFLEVIRDRILYLIAIFALVMVAASFLLPEVSAGAQDKITLDLGLAGIHLLSVIVAVFVGTGLVNKEIEKRTVLVLIAKPVSRAEFLIGKHLGLSAVLAVLIAALAAIFLAVVAVNGIRVSPAERAAGHRVHVSGSGAADGGGHSCSGCSPAPC
jgi:ABC-type transport system involved in multi-copper enzyme maturation permease subunit